MGARDRIARALFDQWFGKSQAVDKLGAPRLVYRGEHGELPTGQVFQSRSPGLSFGDVNTANTYAMDPNDYRDIIQAPRVTPGYLKIEKPIINNPSDPFVDLSHLQNELGDREAARIARKFDGSIQYTGNWDENYSDRFDNVKDLLKQEPGELKNLYFDAFRYLNDPQEVAKLKAAGYDGAMHIGNGENAGEMEYRIFDPSQFWSKYKFTAPPALAGGAAAATQWPPIGDTFAQDQYAQ